jgi:ribosomal protein S18 acetylase RimI-like enzyme
LPPSIKIATSSEEPSVVAVIVLAFSTDPLVRWIWPDPHDYLCHFAGLTRAYGEQAFHRESADYIDGYLGGALWLPPGVHADSATVDACINDTITEDKRESVVELFERMESSCPQEPCWYLPFIGVDSMHRGKGLGSALLEHALARCDHDNTPAFLESSNPRNISLYERHGFEILDTFQIGSSPRVSTMLRVPR